MEIHSAYYFVKPFIPRAMQIILRRKVVLRKRSSFTHIWPIDRKAGTPPAGWGGWPDKKRFALVLTHDIETSKGLERCYPLVQIEEKLGFRSSFNFVPEKYEVPLNLRQYLTRKGCEIGVHGLRHSGNLFKNRKVFKRRASRINHYLERWGSVGFRTPCMYHNLDWIHDLNVLYDASTFDSDPFEPQPDGMGTIFPFQVWNGGNGKGYVELPYTLPQDFTLFILMKEPGVSVWKEKLDWIAECGGMALLITHPDYMNFGGKKMSCEQYPAQYYEEFLKHIQTVYEGQYWHVLPKELAHFWARNVASSMNRGDDK